MFIHIKPDESRTKRRIPQALQFPAPGLPKGNVLLGYSSKGVCPMFKSGECSIYEDRPQTCRDYDCRIFTATGIAVDEEMQPEIAERVRAWTFDYANDASREEHRLLRQAAAFLRENGDLFPPGTIPAYPVQLAALAVRVYAAYVVAEQLDRVAIAQSILAALRG
jgi:Fe-S-cluster containining protein